MKEGKMFSDFYDVWIIEFIVCLVIAVLILKLNTPIIINFKQSRGIVLSHWKWGIILPGIATPWITAFVIWIMLQIKGLPVISSSYIISGGFLFIFCICTIVFAIPFIILSSLAMYIFKKSIQVDTNVKLFEMKLIILSGVIGGIITIAYMTYNLWQNFYEAIEAVILGSPYVVAINLIGIIIGLSGGSITVVADRSFNKVRKVRNLKGAK